ncbi:hypothetical protein [Roseobacter sp. CCS2]|uniref:hypothetical protein n=1 Tax=Roseobacter sp. CCS2 TaxID=391593 RepID=UPI0000F3F7D3|nr:hypothetical protein [Roseobacter sp. CCS2]EBA10633.1 hypothetical protein RCCS2_03247 [Roseobacter sp. CCS2]
MDTALSLPTPAAAATAAAPTLPRAVTTKVQAVESSDSSATLPSNKPYIAQVVTARLSGSEFPENPVEIAPPERTLRPYDMPMLPYDSSGETIDATPVGGAQTVPEESTAKEA